MTSWPLRLTLGLSVLIVVLSPDDVLTRYPVLAGFVNMMARWIRPISAYQRVSEFPEVTGLYFSVMFVVTPIMLLHFVGRVHLIFMKIEGAFSKRPIAAFPIMIGGILLAVDSFFLTYIRADGDEWVSRIPMRSSKLSLAVTGWFAAGGCAWLLIPGGIGAIIVVIRKVRDQLK
jgi:hypothetical protein